MPKRTISALVFVGREFSTSMFDERLLCQDFGQLDKEPIKAGPIGQFSYSQGKYAFMIAPDRVNIRCSEQSAILSDKFISGGRKLAEVVERVRKVAPVTGFGINCDASFYSQEIDNGRGDEFCRRLMNTSLSQHILAGHPEFKSTAAFIFLSGAVRYTVRIEPEAETNGRDLFLAINAHQDVTLNDNLNDQMNAVNDVIAEVRHLHGRILSSQGK